MNAPRKEADDRIRLARWLGAFAVFQALLLLGLLRATGAWERLDDFLWLIIGTVLVGGIGVAIWLWITAKQPPPSADDDDAPSSNRDSNAD